MNPAEFAVVVALHFIVDLYSFGAKSCQKLLQILDPEVHHEGEGLGSKYFVFSGKSAHTVDPGLLRLFGIAPIETTRLALLAL